MRTRFGKKLGRTLVKWGAVSEGQLQKALRKQQERGGILGNWLVDMGFVGDVRMKKLLERFHRRRDLSVADIRVSPEVLDVLPKDVAWTWSVFPLDMDGDEIVVAVPDACKTECLTAVARSTGRTVLPVTCPEAEIREALNRHYGVLEVVDAPWTLGAAPLAKFRFETYVVGEANRRLYEVAMEVAQAPGEKHNPLFIFGEVGHGKTHLLNAVGNKILQDNSSSFVLYLPVVRFADELLLAVERNKLDEFRMLYSRADVLLLDDVQFLADQKAVQEEFANLFEIMQAGGRQIVVTSDRPPEEVETLADRVRSGLGAGLIIAVEDPSVAMKAAILMGKRREHHWTIPDSVITRVAKEVDGDVRKLEGVLRTISARIALDSGASVDQVVSLALSTVWSGRIMTERWKRVSEGSARHIQPAGDQNG